MKSVALPLLLASALPVAAAASAAAAQPQVVLKRGTDAIEIRIGNEPFTTLVTAKSWAKPFFNPVHGPGGTILSRPLEGAGSKDHPHHKGIWFSVDEVNGIKFWAEKGKIANVSVETSERPGGVARLVLTNHWLGADGQPVLEEKSTVDVHPDRLMVFDATLTAVGQKVVFEDTKEGLFAFRMVDSMREKEGGQVVNAEGLKGTKECWGKPSAWVDYVGTVEGKTFGVTLMDDPGNFRPSRYHVRDYGLFSLSPFGETSYTNGKEEAKHLELAPGKSVRLRYGLYVHAGDTQAGKVAEEYRKFLQAK